MLYAYSFGKAQRVLAGIDPSTGPIVVHGAMTALNDAYRAAGVALPPDPPRRRETDPADLKQALGDGLRRRAQGSTRG